MSFKLHHPLNLKKEGVELTQSFSGKDVVVLAKDFTLSRPQYNLLRKGLSFIPTLDVDKKQKLQIEWDLQNYHRKIKLAAYFKNKNKKKMLPFMGPSTWTPSIELLPSEINTLINDDRKSFFNHYKIIRENPNTSREELRALQELNNSKHIVIKPADKGSAVVILSRHQYVFEVERQLNDSLYYKKLDKPIYMETIPLIDSILNTLKNKKFINDKQKNYLKGDLEPRERRFYILPKIHKDPKSWTIPYELPPGRPIVSDCGSETYYTAEYLDFYLNPLSIKHPAYVKDTYHFISIVKNLQVPLNSYFFSLDVDSLYTNIDIQSGINAVKKVFEKYPDPKRPDQELIQLLDINLTKNDFVFNGQYYLQIKGTAMGKKFAPSYANIFMANWEEEVFPKCPIKPFYYLRYLDDIWGIWTGSREEFQDFFDILNTHDPSIKLKKEIDQHSINFLDTTIYKSQNFNIDYKLDIKVYFKTTDTHALLYKTSFHPKHTFKGIVKSQILRFKRICTQREDFIEAVQILFKALRVRGYTRSFLRFCYKTFQERRERDHEELIPLITTFSSASVVINSKLKDNFHRIIGDTGILQNNKIIMAYRRNKNLQDFLVRAKLPPLQSRKPALLDTQLIKLRFIRNNRDRTIIKISQGFNSRSTNCVYVLICSKCGLMYVGETRNSLSVRMYQHRYNIRNQRDVETPVVRHFLIHGLDSVRMAGLQRDVHWTDSERRKKERFWIHVLGTKEPFGLNVKH